jgi:hypothetical protein
MITAFILGALAFQEHIHNVIGGSCSILILAGGIYSMSTLALAQGNTSAPDLAKSSIENSRNGHAVVYRGLFFCVCNGLCDGAMMVPFKLAGTEELVDALRYIASFSIASVIVSPLLFAVYCIVIWRIPDFHIDVALLPGSLSGVLWCLANFMSVHATYFLVILKYSHVNGSYNLLIFRTFLFRV